MAPRAVAVGAAAVVPAMLLGLWQLSADREWVSTLVLPPPAVVLETFRGLWADGTILANLHVSAVRVAKGFAIGTASGLLVGGTLGLSTTFRAYVRPTFMSMYQVNVLAWIPLLILVFGIDEPLKTAVITWSTALPVTINTMQGIAGIPCKWFELARVSQLGRGEVVSRIVIPAALPSLFTGVRSGLGAAWMSLVVVELVASSEGVGFMVVWGRQLFQLDVVLAAIVVIGLVGLSLDLVLSGLERRLRRWHRAAF
ncbi:ABC transporter permease [Anaeromyxobacter oryzae]|uniref:ABC transporter permease n=1 Tax=Anaeromyxobacter oryzae TaxID=2918170 RepID=UPI0020BD485C|nr:ABC transporter permease [Anaeromyxobacter oryzae]